MRFGPRMVVQKQSVVTYGVFAISVPSTGQWHCDRRSYPKPLPCLTCPLRSWRGATSTISGGPGKRRRTATVGAVGGAQTSLWRAAAAPGHPLKHQPQPHHLQVDPQRPHPARPPAIAPHTHRPEATQAAVAVHAHLPAQHHRQGQATDHHSSIVLSHRSAPDTEQR